MVISSNGDYKAWKIRPSLSGGRGILMFRSIAMIPWKVRFLRKTLTFHYSVSLNSSNRFAFTSELRFWLIKSDVTSEQFRNASKGHLILMLLTKFHCFSMLLLFIFSSPRCHGFLIHIITLMYYLSIVAISMNCYASSVM